MESEEFLSENGADLEIMRKIMEKSEGSTKGSTRRGRTEKKSRTRLTYDKHT